jgi:hypothetical protein
MLLRTCFNVVGVRKVIYEMIVKGSGSFDKQSLCLRIKDKKGSLEREGFRCVWLWVANFVYGNDIS